MMAIHTVAAGGGSILTFDGARFRVGPEFRGRQSRPRLLSARRAADGHRRQSDGRQAAAALLPERVRAERRSAAGRRGGAARGSRELATEVARATGVERTPEELAHGCLAIAVDNMANAIKKISIQRGHDIAGYVLCCFGGAAGQHACLVADSLGLTRILVHPLASVLSAYGMGLADVRVIRQRAIEARAGRCADADDRAGDRRARRCGARGARAPGSGAGAHRDRGARAHPLQRHRHAARDPAGRRRGAAPRVRGRAPRPLRLRGRGPGVSWSSRWRSRRSAAWR